VQPKSLALSEVPHKPFGLYLFNALFVLIIIYVQFQNIIGVPIKESMPQLSHAIFLVDKILIFSLFLVFIYLRFLGMFLIEDKETKKRSGSIALLKSERTFFIALVFFGLCCFISAGANKNNLKVTIFGTFAYVVYFLVFFIFSSISYRKNLIKKNYIFLLNFALFLSALSIFQEILALTYPGSISWWPNIQSGKALWRMGLFRSPSVLGHPNNIGMFALFFWTVELAKVRELGLRKNWLKLSLLGLAILFSMSRSAIGGALIALFLLSPCFRKSVLLTFPIMALGAFLFISQTKPKTIDSLSGDFKYDDYRKFAMNKSLDVFKDHPFFGVGPGKYGGHVSLKYNSPIYSNYAFAGVYYDYIHDRVGSIEQQWLQALAELGIVGTCSFIMLMVTPVFVLHKLLRKETDFFFKAFMIALMVMPFQMGFYMLGFTMTQQQEWLVPYFTFVGMLVGMQRRLKKDYHEG
jgi:O-antigen ligase